MFFVSYKFLLDLAIILLTTKVLGLVTRRFNLPQVVGALVAGLIFGPAVLKILEPTDFLRSVSELGVIVLMFSAGITTDVKELRATGKVGFIVALIGVVIPLAAGTGVGLIFTDPSSGYPFYRAVFLGTILTATSVSITVETLREIGKLNTKVGSTILAAALIDDVLGLVCLTVVTSLSGAGGETEGGIALVIVKIAAFFVFAGVVAFLAVRFFNWYAKKIGKSNLQRFQVFAFILCLGLAFSAERFFGVADIIGAFAAGLIVGATDAGKFMESRFMPLSYLLLTPVFFANVGLSVSIPSMNVHLLLFALVIIAAAVLSKLAGCGFGARLCGMKARESIQIGCGMVCRGEVALIVANKGFAAGMVSAADFGPIVLMVVFCSVVTPAMLKLSFRGTDEYAGLTQSALVERYEMPAQIQSITESLVEADLKLRRKHTDGSGKEK
ncbi:MAG: cation:proton antiporter [Oscillospiraceae bacterium]|jgi:Kef-type K+ transport system membrane component KefB|nr:cation:proton antiporter [Oscillospiraceae bacterium]